MSSDESKYEALKSQLEELVIINEEQKKVFEEKAKEIEKIAEDYAELKKKYQRDKFNPIMRIGCQFATLPSIYHMEASTVPNHNFIFYSSGMSIPEVEQRIQSENNDEEQFIVTRLYMRSIFILDILMAIYKAFEAGIVFTKFQIEDFISYDPESLRSSIKSLGNFYYRIYMMECIFAEGEEEYKLLHRIESLVFRRSCRKKTSETSEEENNLDWKAIIGEAI